MKKLILLCGVAGAMALQAASSTAQAAVAAKNIESRRFICGLLG
jgi:hypothetical protein